LEKSILQFLKMQEQKPRVCLGFVSRLVVAVASVADFNAAASMRVSQKVNISARRVPAQGAASRRRGASNNLNADLIWTRESMKPVQPDQAATQIG
jgi:hypothetical protein